MKVMLVHEMSCQHCVDKIAKVLKENNIEANVDLSDKTVTIINDLDVHKTVELLDDIGYQAHIK
ncbi:MAG: cation transporter [Erysipelotrichaceae bacterium]